MHWIEYKKRPSIYYDSSVYERCPVCANELLETTLFKWAMVDPENLCLEMISSASIGLMTIARETRSRPTNSNTVT